MKKFIQNKMMGVSAMVAVGLMTGAESANAAAGKSFNSVAGDIIGGIASLPGLVTGISYMLGVLLAVLGLLKIKDHVENPGNAKLKDGVIYLAIGGALFAVPIITTAMFELISPGENATGAVTSKVKAVEFGVTGGVAP